jgi:hypothetical protein
MECLLLSPVGAPLKAFAKVDNTEASPLFLEARLSPPVEARRECRFPSVVPIEDFRVTRLLPFETTPFGDVESSRSRPTSDLRGRVPSILLSTPDCRVRLSLPVPGCRFPVVSSSSLDSSELESSLGKARSMISSIRSGFIARSVTSETFSLRVRTNSEEYWLT